MSAPAAAGFFNVAVGLGFGLAVGFGVGVFVGGRADGVGEGAAGALDD
jgi:hypothetical protein